MQKRGTSDNSYLITVGDSCTPLMPLLPSGVLTWAHCHMLVHNKVMPAYPLPSGTLTRACCRLLVHT
eukprot:53806-Pelagomonas_calceolata.AAC.7